MDMSRRNTVSVVIPVYGSRAILPTLVQRLEPVVTSFERYEVVFVNDDSPDGAWDTLEQLGGRYSWVKLINLSRNAGQHNALLCGIRHARFEIIVTMDDDLQHPPEEIPTLIDALTDEYDVVYGTPQQQQHGLFRGVAARVTKMVLQSAMGADTARRISAFRAFRTHLKDGMETFEGPYANIDVMLTWGSRRFLAIPVRHDPRQAGVSGYTLRKLIRHALNMVTGFSTIPLQLASFGGFLFTLAGLVILAYVVGRYLTEGVAVPGFAFLASSIAIFSGAQLFALGIIGEYLARVHFRMMDRPAYVVRPRDGSGDG